MELHIEFEQLCEKPDGIRYYQTPDAYKAIEDEDNTKMFLRSERAEAYTNKYKGFCLAMDKLNSDRVRHELALGEAYSEGYHQGYADGCKGKMNG